MENKPNHNPKAVLAAALQEKARRLNENRLKFYKPYAKQLEFHAAGLTHRERLFMAANQVGKTWAGGYEVAMHLTGKYPDWWNGFRFNKPVRWWASGKTGDSTRDNPQRILVGQPEFENLWGTGTIPKEYILGYGRKSGTPNAVDTMSVRHATGGVSVLGFKSYDQGREKWQGPTLEGVWYDEEPPQDIYSEGLTRTNATNGLVFTTFTPLLGQTQVVNSFLSEEKTSDRHVTIMTIDEAEHFSPEKRAQIILSYPKHERLARTKGIPMRGEGLIFPVAEEDVSISPFEIPAHWPQIGGFDFGWSHPTAAVCVAWDRDADIVYITKAHRKSETIPILHVGAVKPWGDWLPWAWPHDGLQHSKDSGEQLAVQYRKLGLKFLPERATFLDGTNGVEAGVQAMLERMETGRWKVFSTLSQYFEEMRLYHREDGKIVALQDDLISASRYAMMMLRFARVNAAKKELDLNINRTINVPMQTGNAGWMGR